MTANSLTEGAVGQGSLDDVQVELFRRDGYVVVPGLIGREEMALIRQWTDEVQGWAETPGKWMKYFEQDDEGRRLLNRVEDLMPFHAGFRGVAQSLSLAGSCSQLFGEPVVLFKDKINFKQAGGGGFEPHQDIQAGWSRYAKLHITALVTIDPSTRQNGCLEVATNFRGQRLIGAEWEPLTAEQLAGIEWLAIEAEPGDAVFFDSYVPHRSGPNLSDDQRRVLYYTYNRASDGDHLRQYYADKRQSYPPDIEREAGKEYRYRV
ncbi:MAG: phytanoyl-CoA dioxygenase family protein [Gammaproteobacteria bacterium]